MNASITLRRLAQRGMRKAPKGLPIIEVITSEKGGLSTGKIIIEVKKTIDTFLNEYRTKRLFVKVKRLRNATKRGGLLKRISLKQKSRYFEPIIENATEVHLPENLLRKRRRRGGVEEVRAYRLNSGPEAGSTVYELGGYLEESIAVLRSTKVEVAGLGKVSTALDFAANAVTRASERFFRGTSLAGYHRAHAWGHGFGDEARVAIAYARERFNLVLQNSGIEDTLRELNQMIHPSGRVRLKVKAVMFPDDLSSTHIDKKLKRVDPAKGEHVLHKIEYDFTVERVGEPPLVGRIEFKDLPPGVEGSPSPPHALINDPELVELVDKARELGAKKRQQVPLFDVHEPLRPLR